VFRYKGKNEDLRKTGKELNVGTILEGMVRTDGDRLRVTARLVNAHDGFQLWSGTYDREGKSIFAVQDEITNAVVHALEVQLARLPGRTPSERHPSDLEAYQLYLQGRYFWHKRTQAGLQKAVEYFERALAADQEYAAAWAGLADAYSLMAAYELEPVQRFGPKAVAAARKAVELDGNSGEAHASLGFALATFAAEWNTAETSFRRAIALNPEYATARQWYASSYLALFGRLDEALQQMEEASSLDPVSAIIHHDLGRIFTGRQEFGKAVQQFRKAIELDPAYARSHGELGFALERLGEFEAALREFSAAVEISGGHPAHVADLARCYAATGNPDQALKTLQAVRDSASAYHLASVYSALGRPDEALRLLQIGFRSKRSPAVVVGRFPALRDDTRYTDLLRRAGLRREFTVIAP
jgi:tetratricopeptide (TPR) repeat protein